MRHLRKMFRWSFDILAIVATFIAAVDVMLRLTVPGVCVLAA